MKIKLLLLAVNLAFMMNFLDHSKLERFRNENTKSLENAVFQIESSNKFEQFSEAFKNRFTHHLENFKQNLGVDK